MSKAVILFSCLLLNAGLAHAQFGKPLNLTPAELKKCATDTGTSTLKILTDTVGLGAPSQLDALVGAVGIVCLHRSPGELSAETAAQIESYLYPVVKKAFPKNSVLDEWAHYHRLLVPARSAGHGSAS